MQSHLAAHGLGQFLRVVANAVPEDESDFFGIRGRTCSSATTGASTLMNGFTPGVKDDWAGIATVRGCEKIVKLNK